MVSGRVKLQLIAFSLLSGGVAANLLILQPSTRSSGESRMASAGPIGFGDTGSIERTGLDQQGGVMIPPAVIQSTGPIPEDAADVTRAVQRELQIRGYETGGVDGVAGLMTRAAVMGFEYDHGLVLTGRPSQALLRRILMGGGEVRAKRIGSEGQTADARDVIRSVQKSLAKLGYKPGRIDGRLTPETARAIREFEVDQALPESGRVSGPLVARLARLASPGPVASRP
jgi:peptidoglycan hydrolase-like protein with peptidoglycan-binding domain